MSLDFGWRDGSVMGEMEKWRRHKQLDDARMRRGDPKIFGQKLFWKKNFLALSDSVE